MRKTTKAVGHKGAVPTPRSMRPVQLEFAKLVSDAATRVDAVSTIRVAAGSGTTTNGRFALLIAIWSNDVRSSRILRRAARQCPIPSSSKKSFESAKEAARPYVS